MGYFGSFFGHFLVLIFFGQKCNTAIFITFSISGSRERQFFLKMYFLCPFLWWKRKKQVKKVWRTQRNRPWKFHTGFEEQLYSILWDNCSICGPVSFFVRGVIWHWAERYNCNIMSQILSFLTHLTSLPVGSISSSHSKISAICWCHFLVWVLIPIDGAAIDGDMLSIVLRTFLARSS